MKNALIITALTTLLSIQCTNKKDAFTIANGEIGSLTSQTTVNQLRTVFANDSIVSLSKINPSDALQGDVEIFSKDGNKLLGLSPNNQNNPDATINIIRVYDSRYKTSNPPFRPRGSGSCGGMWLWALVRWIDETTPTFTTFV